MATRRSLLATATVFALMMATGLLSACGSSSTSAGKLGGSKTTTSLTCHVPTSDDVAVVVETRAGSVVSRCVRADGSKVAAVTLLRRADVETATENYSGGLGLGLCQVDEVPAHYRQCLASGQPYWALFVAADGQGWKSATTGISDIRLGAGESLGLRYDSPKGTAPSPSVAPPLR